MDIGILGAQSAHTVFFGRLLNSGRLGDVRAAALWPGDAPDLVAGRLAETGIAACCATPGALLQKTDAVLLLLRDGHAHAPFAVRCMQEGKPVFVDKPFACTVADAEKMAAASRESGVPMMGGSTLCFLPEVAEAKREYEAAVGLYLSFSADPDSPYSGWAFYGSHLTDLAAAIGAGEARLLHVNRQDGEVTAAFADGVKCVELHTSPRPQDPVIRLQYAGGYSRSIPLYDHERCYEYGMRAFVQMLQTGQSRDTCRLVQSTRLLCAVADAIKK